MIFLRFVHDWMAALSDLSFSNMLEFLDCCNFRCLWCISCIHAIYLDILLLYLIKFLSYAKKNQINKTGSNYNPCDTVSPIFLKSC